MELGSRERHQSNERFYRDHRLVESQRKKERMMVMQANERDIKIRR
jgi:hypothetical protein